MENAESLPLISIIVPVYNVKDYLSKCLQSICGQTYKNLEIILIDDGSSDGSGELCDLFAQRDGRIKVIHQANAGQSAARNRGLAVAQGEFLGFVDSDDWIEPDMYEFLYHLLKENGADISICSHYIETAVKTRVKHSSGQFSSFSREEAIRTLVEDKRIRNYMWDKLYKRQLFAGIYFPVNRVFEDIAVSYQIFYKTQKVVMQDCPKYHYVIREGSAMQGKYNPQKEYQLFLAVCEQNDFILAKGIWDRSPIFVIQRGLHLIDHIQLVERSFAAEDIVNKVLFEIHKYDRFSWRHIGISCAIKRWMICNHLFLYRGIYHFFRLVFKSKRHRF